jgi:hypothetical protein
MFYVVPNQIGNAIDERLDAEIEKCPDAAKDREALRSQLIEYFAEHGVIPDFSLGKRA